MPIRPASAAPALLDIKSANLSLLSIVLKTADLSALEASLEERTALAPDFFVHEPALLDVEPLAEAGQLDALDLAATVQLIESHGFVVLGLKGAHDALLDTARSLGLVDGSDSLVARPAPSTASAPAAATPASPAPPAAPAPTTLVIDKPVRSGQRVYARGADLIVLAMVNPGAEVIADGHVHVYAPLRGKAIAGARGNTQARIFAQIMEAELLSIAGVYRTRDQDLPPGIFGQPTQVSLQSDASGDTLILKPLSS